MLNQESRCWIFPARKAGCYLTLVMILWSFVMLTAFGCGAKAAHTSGPFGITEAGLYLPPSACYVRILMVI